MKSCLYSLLLLGTRCFGTVAITATSLPNGAAGTAYSAVERRGFEPEITVKVAKQKLRVYEMGISYTGQTYEEGKKIGLKDAFRALWCLLKYSATEPAQKRPSRNG